MGTALPGPAHKALIFGLSHQLALLLRGLTSSPFVGFLVIGKKVMFLPDTCSQINLRLSLTKLLKEKQLSVTEPSCIYETAAH